MANYKTERIPAAPYCDSPALTRLRPTQQTVTYLKADARKPAMKAPPSTATLPPFSKPAPSIISLACSESNNAARNIRGLRHTECVRHTAVKRQTTPGTSLSSRKCQGKRTWSFDASMPMFSDMARTTVGAAPRKRPPMPSSLTILQCTGANHRVPKLIAPSLHTRGNGVSKCCSRLQDVRNQPDESVTYALVVTTLLHRQCRISLGRGSTTIFCTWVG
jgi:hypothetical protein